MTSTLTLHRRGIKPMLAALIAVLAIACAGYSAQSAAAAAPRPQAHAAGLLTKLHFTLDAGLAFGAFHHFIWIPLKAGEFAHPLQHKADVAKALLAGAFVYHELSTCLSLAKSDSLLSKLVSPITALESAASSLVADVKGGNTSGLTSDNGIISTIESKASSLGAGITEHIPSL